MDEWLSRQESSQPCPYPAGKPSCTDKLCVVTMFGKRNLDMNVAFILDGTNFSVLIFFYVDIDSGPTVRIGY